MTTPAQRLDQAWYPIQSLTNALHGASADQLATELWRGVQVKLRVFDQAYSKTLIQLTEEELPF